MKLGQETSLFGEVCQGGPEMGRDGWGGVLAGRDLVALHSFMVLEGRSDSLCVSLSLTHIGFHFLDYRSF